MLLLFSLGKRNQYNKRKLPIPVKLINNHHPDLLTSCNLLTLTDKPGKNVKKNTKREKDPISFKSKKTLSSLKDIKANISSKSLQYQYSGLFALP